MAQTALPQLLRPRALRPGDLVVIASLSGPLHAVYEPDLEQAVVVLERMGFRVRRAPLLEAGRNHWWSAGTPAEIAREFNALLRDPEVRAIIAHDGGQTALGYLDLIDVEAITADPKPILGYSDISLLHLVLYARTGLVGFHADLATPGLGGAWQAAPAARRTELEKLYSTLLTSAEPIGALPAGPSWECWRPGRAEGRLIGGVINRIVLAQATRYALPLEWFDGAVLFWEETGGLASYVWSYLQVLRHSGILDRISGMVVGVPHGIDGLDSPDASPTLPEIVLDVLGDRDIPVLGNVEFGHAGPNLPMPVGIRVALDARLRSLSLLEPAVRGGRPVTQEFPVKSGSPPCQGARMRPQPALLPRSTPAASGVSSRSIAALLDRLEAQPVEPHSIMVVRHGHVVAEGWWAPYSAGRPHLLYSLTKSFTSVAVGLAIADGRLSLDDRVVDVLPDHVPTDISEQGRRITVHHLLSMTAGHSTDSLAEAWRVEPGDLVKGFLRVPVSEPEGTRHTYDNATTFILARMVERVMGRGLPELLDDRLFRPMGVDHAEWDRVASGAAFGFHGLHLTTEAVAAFGELLLRGGRWGDRQLIPREWVELATRKHIETRQVGDEPANPDFLCGYGYQFWMSRHGYHGHGAYGQHCLVVPSHDIVIAVTCGGDPLQDMPGALWDLLLPGLDGPVSTRDDEILAERLRRLSFPPVRGSAGPSRSTTATIDASAEDSALPSATTVAVEPVDGGWHLRLGHSIKVTVGHRDWRESSPLGRPVVAAGAWQGDTFVADLFLITTPHRVRLVLDAGSGTAVATWSTVPLTGPSLELHLRSPLMTRPDVA